MDIPRQRAGGRPWIRRIILSAILVSLLGAAVVGIGRMQPALPPADADKLWSDTVKRGPMLRQVRGTGTLVPEEVIWRSATTDGRVEKIPVHPGDEVEPETVIMQLANPTLTSEMAAAEYELRQTTASLADLEVTLQNTSIDKRAQAAQADADYQQALIAANRDTELGKLGLLPRLDAKLSTAKAELLDYRNKLEKERIASLQRSIDAQLDAQHVKIEQLTAALKLKRDQVSELQVRAGVRGILQEIGSAPGTAATADASPPPLEQGQNVQAGTLLAKIAQRDKLKAQIKITETEATDLTVGQAASIDTHNGTITGRVARISPHAANGTVLVDVLLTSALPAGARPDLGVDGTIDIEKVSDVLFIGRPSSAQANASIALFRFDSDGKTATRTNVRLGRASVNIVEVRDGLVLGDRVILSDLGSLNGENRIRFK